MAARAVQHSKIPRIAGPRRGAYRPHTPSNKPATAVNRHITVKKDNSTLNTPSAKAARPTAVVGPRGG